VVSFWSGRLDLKSVTRMRLSELLRGIGQTVTDPLLQKTGDELQVWDDTVVEVYGVPVHRTLKGDTANMLAIALILINADVIIGIDRRTGAVLEFFGGEALRARDSTMNFSPLSFMAFEGDFSNDSADRNFLLTAVESAKYCHLLGPTLTALHLDRRPCRAERPRQRRNIQ
jgi:hypothetical protein